LRFSPNDRLKLPDELGDDDPWLPHFPLDDYGELLDELDDDDLI
jgi:hypothetical protein